MKRKTLFNFLWLVGLTLALSATLAGSPSTVEAQEPEKQNDLKAIEVNTGPSFSYQGYLQENDSPVNATCRFAFSLFDAAVGGNQLGSTQTITDVNVVDGIFAVVLNRSNQFGEDAFNGQARWLEISVDCGPGETTLSERHALLAVPYAHSLRPGATINGAVSSQPVLDIRQMSAGDAGLRVHGGDGSTSDLILGGNSNTLTGDDGRISSDPNYESSDLILSSNDTVLVELNADASPNDEDSDFEVRDYNNNLLFNVDSTLGVYARSLVDSEPDLILGGTSNSLSGDNGIIGSDPAFTGSDIVLSSNDTVLVELDADGSGDDADFEVRDSNGNRVFNVDNSAGVQIDLNVGGNTADSDFVVRGNGNLLFDVDDNGGVWMDLNPNGSATDSDFVVSSNGNLLFNVDDNGGVWMDDDTYAHLTMRATTPTDDVEMFMNARGDGTDRGQLGTLSNHDLVIFTNSQPRIVIGNDGGVCIGNC